MSKHTWISGDTINENQMNMWWGVDATSGHIHDGTDADGHAPKINLTTGVTGPLNINSDGTVNTLSASRVLASNVNCTTLQTNTVNALNLISVNETLTGPLTAPHIISVDMTCADMTCANIVNNQVLTVNGTVGTQVFGGLVDVQSMTGRIRLFSATDLRLVAVDGTMAFALTGPSALQIVGLNNYVDNTAAKTAFGGVDNWVYRQGDFLAITHS